MRLSERLVLQHYDTTGYVLANDQTGDEADLITREVAFLWVGLTYFVQHDNLLRNEVVEALRMLTSQAREDAREVLIGALGSLGIQDTEEQMVNDEML